jgi:asparagine synthase (glutamine-hydrolysing)
MCGIAGFFLPDRSLDTAQAASMVTAMSNCLAHRGPDSADIKILSSSSSLVALGHRRLAIVDLSEAGHQPMVSRDGRFTIVYNGETYALDALRQALLDDGYNFRGHSDTEIMLEYMARWGVERALPLLEGMFAFALWDDAEKTLTIARDRVGIKPLYWMNYKGTFAFASELKAFAPLWKEGKPSVSKQAQLLYAQNGYIPAPHTIYEHVFKLQPGHFLKIKAGTGKPEIHSYWQWREMPDQVPTGNLTDHAHDVLSESVRITLDADVPVGCFLSGGIDSSLVTALMQSHVSKPVKTFAIGFEQQALNEAPYAKAVAQHLGTDHTELIVSESDMLNVVPMLADMYDEPFADSSQIPTYLVSKLAREKVTVSLSGDGGDELFIGYSRYHKALQASALAGYMPRTARQLLRNHMTSLRSVIGGPSRASSYMRLLASPDFGALYNNFLTYDTPLRQDDEKHLLSLTANSYANLPMAGSFEQKIKAMRRVDFHQYMVDDVLTKVDRASMKMSLESRVPLLNNRVIDLACRLPVDQMIDNTKGKLILRDVLAHYVPRNLFERPKMGFGVPMDVWIRGPLKDMVSSHIESALDGDAPFDAVRIRKALQEHLSGKRDNSYILWLVATYGGWKIKQGS